MHDRKFPIVMIKKLMLIEDRRGQDHAANDTKINYTGSPQEQKPTREDEYGLGVPNANE